MEESRRRSSVGRQQSECALGLARGHHRGRRAGHALTGVARELGRNFEFTNYLNKTSTDCRASQRQSWNDFYQLNPAQH